jgi:hypothetical protein
MFMCVGFETFTAVTMKNAVFWDVAPCRSCVNRRFGGTYRLCDAASRIYRRTSFCLLRERIHYTRHELDAVSEELFKLHLHSA